MYNKYTPLTPFVAGTRAVLLYYIDALLESMRVICGQCAAAAALCCGLYILTRSFVLWGFLIFESVDCFPAAGHAGLNFFFLILFSRWKYIDAVYMELYMIICMIDVGDTRRMRVN